MNYFFANGSYKNTSFYFEYDVVPKIKSDLDNEGISNEGTDYFNKLYNNLLTAVTETLLDTKNINFVVIALCDIKKGIEAVILSIWKTIAWHPWRVFLMMNSSNASCRNLKAAQTIFGDEIGQHLEYNDIQMGDFPGQTNSQPYPLLNSCRVIFHRRKITKQPY